MFKSVSTSKSHQLFSSETALIRLSEVKAECFQLLWLQTVLNGEVVLVQTAMIVAPQQNRFLT